MVKIDGGKCIVCESCIDDCFFKALSNEDNKIIISKDYIDTFKSNFKDLKEKTK